MQGKRFCQTFILLALEWVSKEIGSRVGEVWKGREIVLSETFPLCLFYCKTGNICPVGLSRIIHVWDEWFLEVVLSWTSLSLLCFSHCFLNRCKVSGAEVKFLLINETAEVRAFKSQLPFSLLKFPCFQILTIQESPLETKC